MRYLSLTIVVLILAVIVHGQTSPHGKSLQIDCAQCHTSKNWKVNPTAIQFNHDDTNFKLVGQHIVTNCKDCHLNLTFKDGRRNCLDCHTDAHNQSLGKDCEKCHTPKSWVISDVTAMHQKTRFPLLGAHRTVNCSDCHKSASKFQYEPLGIECINCHNTDFQKTTTPNHVTNKYSTFCLECHNENSNSWRTTLISHESFPLTGGHNVGCGFCHTTGHYTKIAKECNTCHNKQYVTSQIPKHQVAGIPVKCETCHTTSTWKPSSFNHLSTGFELKGSHKNVVQCFDCHKGNLTSAKQTCISCHQVKYDNAPNHKTANYPLDCTQCHTQLNWVDNTFNHSTTNYPLTGAHQKVKCGDCHLTTLKGTPTICGSCHLTTYTNSQVPAHTSAGIPKECATCHTTAAWKPSSFNHTTTGYELKGAHKLLVQCSLCHKGNLTSAPQTCVGCHQAKYDSAPNHKTQGYPTDCVMCHTQNNWLENSFNHSTTAFPLTGAHTTVFCSKCHTVGFKGTSTVCSSCHLPAYTSSKLPDHVAAGIPKECATCHTTVSWKPSSFTHTTTGYELKGAHKSVVQCSQCHKGNVNTALTVCVGCHQAQYDVAPAHKKYGFSSDCAKCHTQDNWLSTNFDHTNTNFPLTGAHSKVTCVSCHANGYTGTSAVCSSCHLPVYTSSQLPGHVAAGIPKECATCHTTASWKPASFNHTSTGYELKGAHKSVVQCSQCHKGNVTTAPPVCIGCHQAQYDVAPAHKKNGFSTDCAKCHTQDNWLSASFDHSTTNFPLTGSHTKVLCASCHVNGYTGTPTACSSCHLPVYTSSQLPGHVAAGIPKECATCHTTAAWKPSTFNHTTTGYELKGAHKLIVQCSQCHKGNVTTAALICVGCHQAKYDAAPNHKVQGYPTDCAMCHTQNNWLENSFNHATTAFPLTGSHTSVLCSKCHTVGFKGTPTACNSCHLPVYTSSQLPGHVAAGIPKECATCHTTAAWKPSTFNHTTTGYELKGAHKLIVQCSQCHKGNVTTAALTCVGCHQAKYDAAPNHKAQGYPTDCAMCHTMNNWLENSFNHATTAFPLTGSHTSVLCSKCHTVGFKGTPTACSSCHLPVFTSSQLPGHVAAGIPKECATCHTTAAWKPSTFNHTTTGYELKGAHKLIIQCSQCHKGNVTSASLTCIGCHQAQYDVAPSHKSSGFSTDCSKCHSQDNWLSANFDHSTTNFPLMGAHTKVLCTSCHVNGYAGTSTACSSCHLPVYTSSQLPGHVAAGIPKECATCHTTAAWKPSTFNHTTTGYELKGAHKLIVQCSQCHKGNVTTAALTCVGCHQAKYDAAPNHKAQGYPTDCAMCHTQNNWLENSFNHATTAFPLTGSHTSVLCSKCHTVGFKGTPTACSSCHLPVYTSSQLPGHVAAGIPKECATCHTTAVWKPSTFNHTTTGYELKGAHKLIVQCSDCHKGNVTSAALTCVGCHQAKYDAALNHKAQGYPTDCAMCHTQNNWLENSFNHATTAFPLTGSHTTVLCSKCHTVGFKGTPTACTSCHLPVYTSSQLPGHVAAGIPKECATCHTTVAWKPSTFNHTTTGYELKGAHKLIVQCSQCHKGNVTTAALTCVGCHQAKYDAALNHKAQGYPTDCAMCHTQNNWLENSFNHATTAFPLTGSHTSVLCSKCHTVGFKGTPTACSSCHLPVYTSSQLPGHVAAGIPKECATCHTTAAWKPSTFNHTTTGYELKGAHKLIVQCSQCHKGNVTSAALTCIGCHQSNYDTAPNHKAQGYPTDCAMCHTQNNWLENSFNHATTAFPLTGAHNTALCSKCHITTFKGTSTLCFTCHATKYNASTNPNHLAAKFPTNCEICHSTTAWTPSTYNHDAQYFPINSGRHKGAWTLCTECHTVATNYATFSCIVCHTHSNKAGVDSNHKGVKNYTYTGTSCYTCHPRGLVN